VPHSDDYSAMSMAEIDLRRDEGTHIVNGRHMPYVCPTGHRTIGYGRNLDANGVSQDEADAMLAHDVQICRDDLHAYPWWHDLSCRRKSALLNMRFCLGRTGFRSFKNMLAAIEAGDYYGAGDEVENSRFAQQVGARAIRIADALRAG